MLTEAELAEIDARYEGEVGQADAKFVASARQDVPRLMAEVRQLRALLRPFADMIADPGEHVSGYHSTETLLESDPDVREEFYTSLGPFQAAYRAIYPKGS